MTLMNEEEVRNLRRLAGLVAGLCLRQGWPRLERLVDVRLSGQILV